MHSLSFARHALLGAAVLAGGGSVAAPAPVPACPARIETEQSSTATGGWSAERPGTAKPLAEIGFFDGPVRDKVQLAPTNEVTGGPMSTATWAFAKRQSGVRLACLYRGTDIVLSRPLPSGIRQCTVTTRAHDPVVKPDALVCR